MTKIVTMDRDILGMLLTQPSLKETGRRQLVLNTSDEDLPSRHEPTAATVPRWLAAVPILLYPTLAIALTWPLVASIRTTLPVGTEQVATVPLLNAWTIWWNADRAGHAFAGYWDAPIFAPLPSVFTFSESQPTTLVVAPLAATLGIPAAYNIYLLLLLTLNGWLAFRLLRRVGFAIIPALLGGAIMEALPIVHWQLGVLQLVAICGPIWLLDRLVALRDRPTPLRAGLLGLAAALCYAACNYWGLFLSILLPLACWPLLWGRLRDFRMWLSLGGAIVIALLLASPILWAQIVAKRQYSWSRNHELIEQLSAHPQDYLNPPWNRLPIDRVYQDQDRHSWHLGLGPVALAAAALGILCGLVFPGQRRWTLFLALFAGLAFGLSLGPAATVPLWTPWHGPWEWSPYGTLMELHPGLAIARSPFRFAFFVQIALTLLAANFLEAAWRGSRWLSANWRPIPRAFVRATATLLIMTLGGLAIAESWPEEQPLYKVPPLDADWITWIREHGSPGRPILCLPFPNGRRVDHYERTAEFMYEQIGHGRPLVGGYTGFFPDEYLHLREQMQSFPDRTLLEQLRHRNVEFVVTAHADSTSRAERSPALRLVFRDESSRVSIYRLLPSVP